MIFVVDEAIGVISVFLVAHEVRRQRDKMKIRIYFICSILLVLIYFSSILMISWNNRDGIDSTREINRINFQNTMTVFLLVKQVEIRKIARKEVKS